MEPGESGWGKVSAVRKEDRIASVDAISLDEWHESVGFPEVRIVKIDAEGSEPFHDGRLGPTRAVGTSGNNMIAGLAQLGPERALPMFADWTDRIATGELPPAWWLGLRDVEREKYTVDGSNFERDERGFRMGFEAALQLRNRNRSWDESCQELTKCDARVIENEVFRRGYERGLHYLEAFRKHAQPQS
jgi:hypothetical protein